jgi:16S rRNA (adenine1518-N6/adenine1519-N6)-dimethyltransferase
MKRKRFAKKSLGQHFLRRPSVAARIVEAARIRPEELVVELGPGEGALTERLLGTGARVVAVELDRDLAARLRERFGEEESAGRLEVIEADFTKIALTSLAADRGTDRCVLVGNIPYNETRHVLFSFLVDEVEVIDRSVLMLQKEVGERIVSPPGSRVYGITSVILQALYEVRALFAVPAEAFWPKPSVDSVVLGFARAADPLVEGEAIAPYLSFVKRLFQQRRKTLQKILKNAFSLTEEELDRIAEATKLDLGSRPEQMSKEDLLALARETWEVSGV